MNTSVESIENAFRSSPRLLRLEELKAAEMQWPVAGIYGWWFDTMPGECESEGTLKQGAWRLLYVGVGGKSARSSRKFRSRLLDHVEQTARRSTLRLSLGSLLLGSLKLTPVPYANRLSFGDSEVKLTNWLHQHARVNVVSCARARAMEKEIIPRLHVPLNYQHNSAHGFFPRLSAARKHVQGLARAQICSVAST